jgi:hypothetical protein
MAILAPRSEWTAVASVTSLKCLCGQRIPPAADLGIALNSPESQSQSGLIDAVAPGSPDFAHPGENPN